MACNFTKIGIVGYFLRILQFFQDGSTVEHLQSVSSVNISFVTQPSSDFFKVNFRYKTHQKLLDLMSFNFAHFESHIRTRGRDKASVKI